MRITAPLRRIGNSQKHSFFGYYNKSNFCKNNRYLLANRTDMFSQDLSGTEIAEVGYYDIQNADRFHKIGETTTWNWQMGCQLQWVGNTHQVVYNTRVTHKKDTPIYPDFQATITDIHTGNSRALPLPIYVVSPKGDFALTLDYSRFMVTHRTIGYATHSEPSLALAPKDDGIYYMDINTGAYKLVLSLDDLCNFQPVASMDNAMHWVTHMEINPSGNRCLFIHRWTERVLDETCFLHRLFSMNPDGSDLKLLECSDHPLPQLQQEFDINAVGTFEYEKSEYQISHPMWKSDTEIIVWSPHNGHIHYHLYDQNTVTIVGKGILNENGHMTYSTDGRWLLSDTYPDANTHQRILFVFDTKNNTRIDLASLYTPPDLGKHNRCDLHPKWSRNNKTICIDSVHEKTRQMYIICVDT